MALPGFTPLSFSMKPHEITLRRLHDDQAEVWWCGKPIGIITTTTGDAMDLLERIFDRGAGALWEEFIRTKLDDTNQLTFNFN